jgi:tetratricopeptide (TPR) repeat protein
MTASTLSRAILILVFLAGVAHAQKNKDPKKVAKQYTDAAIAAQDQGDYDQAVELYQKAYDLVPHPILVFNIGQAHRLAGRDEEALDAYKKYVELDPKGAKAKEAQGFIKEIEPRVIKARAAAEEAAKKQAELDAARKAAEEKAEAERKAREEAEAKRKADAEKRKKAGGGEPAPKSNKKMLGLIIGGSGLAVAAGGGVFGFLAMGAWGDAKDVCGGELTCANQDDTDRANDLADTASLYGNVSTVMIGVGAAALVTGAVLYFTAPKSGGGDERAWMLVPTGDGAMVSFSGAL